MYLPLADNNTQNSIDFQTTRTNTTPTYSLNTYNPLSKHKQLQSQSPPQPVPLITLSTVPQQYTHSKTPSLSNSDTNLTPRSNSTQNIMENSQSTAVYKEKLEYSSQHSSPGDMEINDETPLSSPLQSTSPNGTTITSNSNSRSKKKRNRIPLSCTICRKRKVKCDKLRPHCKQCTKTGVAHLCHYMEQSWAEEAEKELTKDHELKKLRDRVKSLEKTLSKLHSSTHSTPNVSNIASINSPIDDTINSNSNNNSSNNSNNTKPSDLTSPIAIITNSANYQENDPLFQQNESIDYTNALEPKGLNVSLESPAYLNHSDTITTTYSKHDNDELNLSAQFDLLHIKRNGTIHLGATHWLAIMKGDPYLKLLWRHIFAMNEKLQKWYSQKNAKSKAKRAIRKCPVLHHLPEPVVNNQCPVNHMNLTNNNNSNSSSGTGKLDSNTIPPLDSNALPHLTSTQHPQQMSSSDTNLQAQNFKNNNSTFNLPTQPSLLNNQNPTPSCPVIHTNAKNEPNNRPKIVSNHKSLTHLPSLGNMNQSEFHYGEKRTTPSSSPSNIRSNLTVEQALDEISLLLPPKDIIIGFFDIFFRKLYQSIPILDEKSFKNHIFQILTPSSSKGKRTQFKMSRLTISNVSDYSNLGILIIILRLAWLSLPNNTCKIDLGDNNKSFSTPLPESGPTIINTNDSIKEEILMKYETSEEALQLCHKYLVKFDEISSVPNNNINFSTIQFAIFYKFYLQNTPSSPTSLSSTGCSNPSNGYDIDSHQLLLSTIIQMAFSCGLHRDPNNFPQLNATIGSPVTASDTLHDDSKTSDTQDSTKSSDTEESKKQSGTKTTKKDNQLNTEWFKHTWRKIWYYIVSLDVHQSLSLGCPRLLRNLRDFSDTKLPAASKIDYIHDIKELIIVKNFTLFFQIDLCIISVLNHILNVSLSRSVRKSDLDSIISLLRDLTYGHKNIHEVLTTLIDKDLLPISEGEAFDQSYDDIYDLPTLDEILNPTDSLSHSNNENHNGRDNNGRINLTYDSPTRVLFFSKHMTIRMLLYLINYILFTHYEPMDTEDPEPTILAKEYAQQALDYAMDGYKNCMIFFSNVSNPNSIFYSMSVVLSMPLLDIGHRVLQFIVCLLLRVKCGPLIGTKESSIIKSTTLKQKNNEVDESKSNTKIKKECPYSHTKPKEDFTKRIELNMGESLADVLMSRMFLFHELTKQLSNKYSCAIRMVKSTEFFISLLGTSSAKTNSKTDENIMLGGWKHPNISNMSGFFKGDKEQLKRCPVYQDALGFVGSNVHSSDDNHVLNPRLNSPLGVSEMNGTQLPPLRAYKPITYTASDVRGISDGNAPEPKRQRLNYVPGDNLNGEKAANIGIDGNNNDNRNSVSDFTKPISAATSPYPSLPNSLQIPQFNKNGRTSPLMPSSPNMGGSLAPLSRVMSPVPIRQRTVKLEDPSNSVRQQLPSINDITQHNTLLNEVPSNEMEINQLSSLTSPQSSDVTSSSTSQQLPELEDFLMENSNFNGLMIDPTRIVEAVAGYNGHTRFGENDPVDFLPLDNMEIDGSIDVNSGVDFMGWE